MPESISQYSICLVQDVRSIFPSEETAMAFNLSVCPSNLFNSDPVSTSQMRAVLSSEPVNIFVPSVETAIDVTLPECPSNFLNAFPDSTSQMRAVLSSEPVNTFFPSPDTAIERI